ncbi:tyrosine-protein phosphatase [Fusibacter paucivorans]|uniref:Tyrosine-protein phosphatase n=1 Tax=Fusibacter paucivorans TaxID=76009 RepID=A0ABS5PT67_9FIRM|nr:tyrosine-protein phosphatase [Fusibacter paucivorans]MBS7528067.1 tyrosine-protein phosphatase [Fusibacter paucivorans]
MRRYPMSTLYNMRDLGGYPTLDGSVTQFGRFFRSDCPVAFSAKDIDRIDAMHISCVIDLRIPPEIKESPSFFANRKGVDYHNISFITGNKSPDCESAIAGGYLKMFEDQKAIVSILHTISNAEANVFYHCAVGKDRTGVVSALLLKICGVSDEDVIADYQLSATYLHPMIIAYKREHPECSDWVGNSKPEYMRDCLKMLYEKYGTFEHYLQSIAIDTAIIRQVRRKLMKP